MKWLVWLIVAVVVIAALLIYLYYPVNTSVNTAADQACINSGGTITTQLCCKSANDFPNTCLIGACGCSPDNSHQVKVCNCGEGKCWDSEKSQCV